MIKKPVTFIQHLAARLADWFSSVENVVAALCLMLVFSIFSGWGAGVVIVFLLLFWMLYIKMAYPSSPENNQDLERIMATYGVSHNQAARVLKLMNTPPNRWPQKARGLFQTSISRLLAQQGDAIESVLAEHIREEDYQREVVDGLPQV